MSLTNITFSTPAGLSIVGYGDDDPVRVYCFGTEAGEIVPDEDGPEYNFIPDPHYPGFGIVELKMIIATIQTFEQYRAKLLADRRDDEAGVRRLP